MNPLISAASVIAAGLAVGLASIGISIQIYSSRAISLVVGQIEYIFSSYITSQYLI